MAENNSLTWSLALGSRSASEGMASELDSESSKQSLIELATAVDSLMRNEGVTVVRVFKMGESARGDGFTIGSEGMKGGK